MSKHAVALMVGLLVAGLLAVGCGGDDADADEEGTATITKAALIKQGDQICARIEKSITAQGSQIFNAPQNEGSGPGFQVKIVNEVLVPEYQTMAEDIRALGGPADDEEQRDTMYDAMEQRVVVMGEDPKGFFKPDPADEAEFEEMLALVKGYGFKRCYQ